MIRGQKPTTTETNFCELCWRRKNLLNSRQGGRRLGKRTVRRCTDAVTCRSRALRAAAYLCTTHVCVSVCVCVCVWQIFLHLLYKYAPNNAHCLLPPSPSSSCCHKGLKYLHVKCSSANLNGNTHTHTHTYTVMSGCRTAVACATRRMRNMPSKRHQHVLPLMTSFQRLCLACQVSKVDVFLLFSYCIL